MPRTYAAVRAGGGAAIGAKDRPDHLSAASDQQVVAWAKQGHEPAFRELVRRYERPIFSLLYRMVRDRALAEDLAQETFIKVLNAIRSEEHTSELQSPCNLVCRLLLEKKKKQTE